MTITEKVAYIKGLVEGLNLDESKPEIRVLAAVVDLLDEMAGSITCLEDSYDDVADQLDAVDEDLYLLEEDFYEGEQEGDDLFYEVTCPSCNETICLSDEMVMEGAMECPNCGENLEFTDCCCDDPGCTCGDQPAE